MAAYQAIQSASLEWRDGLPFSVIHHDVYFSCHGGLAETQYVFIEGNNLPERWIDCDDFTIAETGFGTGLNFLCTVRAWLAQKTAGTLFYISVEKHPLQHADLKRAHACWPELALQAEALQQVYPSLSYGFHPRSLFNGRVKLLLLFGDAAALFAELQAQVDAWYLDGFSPDVNPDMWHAGLYQQMQRLTSPNGTLSTFTAAGHVRRALIEHGFSVVRRKGFALKREMLVGQLQVPCQKKSATPWFVAPNYQAAPNVIVIGAGLAGCSVSHALAQRGWQVNLLEQTGQIASGASGNLAGVCAPRLSVDMSVDGQFYLSAFLYATHFYNQLKLQLPSLPWFQSGVMQLCDLEQQQRLACLSLPNDIMQFCDAQKAGDLLGYSINSPTLLYPQAGWLSPPALCQALLDVSMNVTLKTNCRVDELLRTADGWSVLTSQGALSAPYVIICNGYQASQLLPQLHLPLIKTRGQLSYLPSAHQTLNMPVCYDGYALPSYLGKHCVGVTYGQDDDEDLREADEMVIVRQLNQTLMGFDAKASGDGRVAFRTASADRLPLLGGVFDSVFYQQQYADLRHGKRPSSFPQAQYLDGLFVNLAHGSRGLSSCVLSAEILAAMLNQEPLPLSNRVVQALHPARFLIRQLKRA